MKISKLFHWLYAILMLLPIMVFIPNAFYYGFNKEAVAQEKTEQVPVYYESNEINSSSDFIVGNVYHWNNNYTRIHNTRQAYFTVHMLNIYQTSPNGTIYLDNNGGLYFLTNDTYYPLDLRPCDFLITSLQSDVNNMYSDVLSKFSICNVQYIKEYQPLVTNMSITDSMSYAWDSVWQNDLFSWSYGSFLTQPFIYIGSLFNVPVDNTLYYALSYWLDISIIWLTFDLLMYVPLLVHRWLDKGIIE